MSVIEFKPKGQKSEESPHGTGEAFCIDCEHTWVAVAPNGTRCLECPSCHRMTGKFKFEWYPPPGTMVRVCDCGNQLFYLTQEGHLCANCGTYQRYD